MDLRTHEGAPTLLSLKMQCDAVARRLFELILGGFVEIVALEAVQMAGRECIEGEISVRSEGTRETRREVGACKVSAAADSGNRHEVAYLSVWRVSFALSASETCFAPSAWM